MKILIIGAGPAGLSFAALMAEADPTHEITIVEKNAPDARPGFGITLRSEVISFLGLASKTPIQHLEGRAFRYRGDVIVDLQNPSSAHLVTLSRAALLTTLTDLCSQNGVRLRFASDVAGLAQSEFDEFDLIVAADGAHSAVRRLYEHAFTPAVQLAHSVYGWFGVNTPIHKLTIVLTDTEGVLLAWGYKYTESLSTLIVECSERTIDELGLHQVSAHETARKIGNILAFDLPGGTVRCGTTVRWAKFPTVSCDHLWHRNIVLIGDAAHTTHFSQGFGTMFAFDDAMALRAALATTKDVRQALEHYETTQRPKIAQFQELASRSMDWSEMLIEMAESRNEAKVRELIKARWPKNDAPSCPGVKEPELVTSERLSLP
jgi:anthraniloyl-CoA monooxygenase